MVAYDSETFSTNRAVLYAFGLYTLSYLSSEHYHDITKREYEKSTNDCVDFKENHCINDFVDHTSEFKADAKRVNNKIVKFY